MKLLKNIFKLIKIAFSNKNKYKVVDEALNGYWFDYGYLYNIELAKLIEMRDAFKEKGISADNEKYVRQMDLAIKLLKIIINDEGCHFDEERNYVCDVNVNLNNAERFVNDKELIDYYTKRYPHELYILKAQYLYHKLRFYFERYWWD